MRLWVCVCVCACHGLTWARTQRSVWRLVSEYFDYSVSRFPVSLSLGPSAHSFTCMVRGGDSYRRKQKLNRSLVRCCANNNTHTRAYLLDLYQTIEFGWARLGRRLKLSYLHFICGQMVRPWCAQQQQQQSRGQRRRWWWRWAEVHFIKWMFRLVFY